LKKYRENLRKLMSLAGVFIYLHLLMLLAQLPNWAICSELFLGQEKMIPLIQSIWMILKTPYANVELKQLFPIISREMYLKNLHLFPPMPVSYTHLRDNETR